MVTVLFTNRKSVYKQLQCDCYDIDRNVKSFNWDRKVIAHPPCRQFSRLKGLSKKDDEEYELVLKTLNHVNRYGGIIEHPLRSDLFKRNEVDQDKIIYIDQHWFGFKAHKPTLLYIVGAKVDYIPFNMDAVEKSVQNMWSNERSITTEKLAKWLIEIYNKI